MNAATERPVSPSTAVTRSASIATAGPTEGVFESGRFGAAMRGRDAPSACRAPPWGRVMLGQEAVALEDELGRGGESQVLVARLAAQHLEGGVLVEAVALHQDALGPLDQRALLERGLDVRVVGEAPRGDVDRAAQRDRREVGGVRVDPHR